MRHAARQAPSWLIFDVRQEMNRLSSLLAVVAASFAAHVCFATLPEPWVAGEGQFRGSSLEVWVTPGEHMNPRWNPEKDVWPMSTEAAIEAARKSLQEMVGEDHRHFVCDKISFQRFFTHPSTEKASFYFLVIFESAHESQITRNQEPGYAPAIIPFVVFPDGYVKVPKKKKPNKAPEPTPGSVTPHASSGESK